MTANTGKGADGKSGGPSTGSDAKSGRTRKKTSAAKPRSDEVSVRTNGSAPKDDADDTVTDVPVTDDDDTSGDAEPAAADDDDDATVVDSVSAYDSSSPESDSSSSSSSSSVSAEEESGRTATFSLPQDLGSGSEKSAFGQTESDDFKPEPRSYGSARRDDATKFPQESGEVMPSSGRSAAMDAPTPPSSGFGGGTPPSGGPSGNTPSGGRPALGAGSPMSGSAPSSYAPSTPGPTSRGGKLTGALRKPGAAGSRKPPRKAHLQVARFEPWSVMKFSFIMSLVCFLVLFVAVAVLYVILSWLGVFGALSSTIHDLTSNDQGKSGGINPASWFSAARILGYTALIGTLNVLLITALATVWSVIYNMAADLVGGVEVTLKEADQ
jgi:Transmembrane domain of unknown function (DUF3566)